MDASRGRSRAEGGRPWPCRHRAWTTCVIDARLGWTRLNTTRPEGARPRVRADVPVPRHPGAWNGRSARRGPAGRIRRGRSAGALASRISGLRAPDRHSGGGTRRRKRAAHPGAGGDRARDVPRQGAVRHVGACARAIRRPAMGTARVVQVFDVDGRVVADVDGLVVQRVDERGCSGRDRSCRLLAVSLEWQRDGRLSAIARR